MILLTMKFIYDKKNDQWETKVLFQNAEVKVLLEVDELEEDSFESLTEDRLSILNSLWDKVQSKILNYLLNLYNTTWADEEDGFPELTREEFITKIKLNWISISEFGKEISLWFTESGLFGNHSVNIFIDEQDVNDPTLAG